jgi:hypothetical protein
MEIVSIQEPLGIKYHGVHFKSLDRGDDEPRVKYGGFSVTDNDVGILGSSKMVRSKPSAVGTGKVACPDLES